MASVVTTEAKTENTTEVEAASSAKYGPKSAGVAEMQTREKARRPAGVRYCLMARSCITASVMMVKYCRVRAASLPGRPAAFMSSTCCESRWMESPSLSSSLSSTASTAIRCRFPRFVCMCRPRVTIGADSSFCSSRDISIRSPSTAGTWSAGSRSARPEVQGCAGSLGMLYQSQSRCARSMLTHCALKVARSETHRSLRFQTALRVSVSGNTTATETMVHDILKPNVSPLSG
mmetsp:Transcript_25317/g.67153  ORF Transcript_25317/g.67153 Transcript_25317/m.67153 type:complete len:233 (-) Transcript_25317:202-900(-)